MIKITPADKAFSECVRSRVNWTCQRCGKYYPEDRRQGLHCSHFHGRANWGIRFDPLNAFAHCYGCHCYFEGNPHEFSEWVKSAIGEGAYEILLEKKNNLSLGKTVRQTKGLGEIAKHYREQAKAIKVQRDDGAQGPIEFVGWA